MKPRRTLRRLGWGTGVAALALAAGVSPAGSAAARKHCLTGGVTLARGAESKLVIKHHKLWGCSSVHGVSLVLWDPRGAVPVTKPLRPYVTPAFVAGRFAVANLTEPGSASGGGKITVWNLRTGNGHVAPAPQKVHRLGVTSTGAAVWTTNGPDGFEVRAMTVGGVRLLLDSGPRIHVGSLHVRGTGASWVDNGMKRTKHFR